MRIVVGVAMLGVALAACAGRDPEPIATVQPQDRYSDCTMITAEIQANNIKVKELADEQGWKVAQNVVTGVGGIFTFGLTWFGMDFKGAASKDAAALQARQEYLTQLAVQRCAPPSQPPPVAAKRSPRRQAAKTKTAAPKVETPPDPDPDSK